MLNRAEQLVFCKTCTNRKMDMKQGLICSLSNAQAAFTEICHDYAKDEHAAQEEELKATADLNADEVSLKLSPEALILLKERQNLNKGILGGVLVTLLCAVAWAFITIASNYQIGFMAVGVGLAVGYSIQHFGQGLEPQYGIIGAVLALLGCILGNVFSLIGFAAEDLGVGLFEVLAMIDLTAIPDALIDWTQPMDLLFYGIAVYEGYKFSIKKLDQNDLVKLEDEARTIRINQ